MKWIEENSFRIDSALCVKYIIEERKEFNLKTSLSFTDYEKAFDRVRRRVI